MSKITTVYGIPNCDTVKKARSWLSEQGITYQFHDFKKQGVPADKVNAVGKGETEARMTKECQTKFKKKGDLIACIAPDRRVEVDIAAMQEKK